MTDTFGRLLYEPGRSARWIVDNLEPHVAITFKRMFPRVPAHETVLKLSDTDDVRADLLWFLARYPLETKHTELLVEGDRRLRDRLAHRGKILLPEWQPGEVFGFREGKAPYLYQQQAATIALAQGGLLLADEVGLGKTVSALTALAQGAPLPAAIVVQSHLAFQWQDKIHEFTDFTCHIIDKMKPYSVPKADIYIFKYTNVGGWCDVVKKGFLKSVFYDEVQELRTGTDTAKGKACSIISAQAEFRMGLTATATYNYGDEIHTVLEFIKPDILGARDEFLLEWCEVGRQVKDPDGLGSYLKGTGWLLRRTEDDETVNRSMPKPNVIDMRIGWDDDAAADDLALTRTLALSVMEGSFAESGRASRELDAKMRHMTGVAKARSVATYVQMLLRDTRRVVLVGWHRDVYDKWLRMLAPYNPVLYTGSETAVHKVQSMNRFCRGDSRVFIMSLRSGAGLDGLQHFCNDIVFGEFDWSPQVHHQCTGRLRRPGQEQQVNAHYLYTDEGSDPVMIETLGVKSDQARGIHDPGVAQAPKVADATRIKRLAQSVLAAAEIEVQPCAICGGASAGGPRHIIPLHEAFEYEEGPERDALYGPENIWFLCGDHAGG